MTPTISTFSNPCDLLRHRRAKHSAQRSTPCACATRRCVPRHACGRRRQFSPPPPKPFATIQAADMAYQVEGVSITPAELEADSRWIRGVKAHRAAAAHQAIASTPPASPPSKTLTPPPAITPSTTTLRRHAPLPRLPAEDFKIVFRPTPSEPRARLYLRVSELRLGPTSYPLRAYMAAPDNDLHGIIYNAVDSQTQDEIVQDLQAMIVNTSYAIADARQMGRSQSILITFVGTTTLPSAMVFNCGIYRCHPFRLKAEACTNCWAPGHRADVCTKPKSTLCHRCGQAHKAVEPPTCVPCCILCRGAHVTGSRPCKLRFDRNGPSSPPATSKPQPPPPAPPTGLIHKTSRPSRRRSSSRGARSASRHRSVSFPPLPRSEASTAPTTTSPVSWKSQPHTSDPQTAALKATIAAQQLQIQELSRQLQAALSRLSSPASSPPPCPATASSQMPPQQAPAEEPMNTAPSAASSRASSPTHHPSHKRRSPSSDDVAPERDIVRKTNSFLEAFEQRVMARFVRLEERIASVDNRVATIESHLTALDTRVAVLEARQSATEATLAHLSLPSPRHLPQLRPAQKHNRCLRLHLARLASDMEEHCSSLLRQQWGQICDRMAGNQGLRDPTGKPADGETATQFAARLSHYFDRWTELSETAQEYGALRELLIKEQFLIISLDGTPIPLVSTLRILGLFFQSNGKHTTLITRLTNTVHQTIRLIRRIANRHHGMREHDLRRLVQAFVLSRFIYSLPYIFLSRTEEDKVNSLIRQAYKSALSLPTSTSTARSSVSPALGLVAHFSLPLNSPLLPLFPPHCPSIPTSTPC
ncbi:hypothetical protein HPB49_004603 [Dermacentor silvarum]|uniref:Uncharacterized protein n=1 Tax=Dermacentor silvarum TaxID=543639 RepID=A0ACB8DUG0_DERSI|nr:hypothetical protein HPB49_004603 [Dermacentor silvarum]